MRDIGLRMTFPSFILEMSEEQYEQNLRDAGWGENAINKEMIAYRDFMEQFNPKTEEKPPLLEPSSEAEVIALESIKRRKSRERKPEE